MEPTIINRFCRVIEGLYRLRDNGKEDGSYYLRFRL